MRVAISQFATSINVQENLATCIRMIHEAATCKPELIVLPAFCNTQFCNRQFSNIHFSDILSDNVLLKEDVYSTQTADVIREQSSIQEPSETKVDASDVIIDDISSELRTQAWEQALTIEGDFLQKIAEQALKHDCYIIINVTIRRERDKALLKGDQEKQITSPISITSCLFSPEGELIHQVDKQMLTAQENEIFTCTYHKNNVSSVSDVKTTSVGKLGLLIDNDDITFTATRELALTGAQLLCHSMNTFALDQSQCHGPARASENRVFLATANKVDSLITQSGFVGDDCHRASSFEGAGHSQIVSPDGKVLAMMAHNKEGFAFADIDLGDANTKVRADGTDLMQQRRPELYSELTSSIHKDNNDNNERELPLTVNVAIFATYKSNEQAIDDVCHYIENNLTDIIQLPELFFISDKSITHNDEQRSEVSRLCELLITQVSAELRPFQYVCTSLVLDGVHQAVIINDQGLFATQQQLHFCKRYQWTPLGNNVNIIDLPLELGKIKVAMLTADDHNIPEMVEMVALSKIHLLLIPFDIQEPSEVDYMLLSRTAEHRICMVAATREKSFIKEILVDSSNIYNKNKIKPQKSTGFIANLSTNSARLSQWKSRKPDDYINKPLVKHQQGKITKAIIHPIAACQKLTFNELTY